MADKRLREKFFKFFREVFASFGKFFEVFGLAGTCLDLFGCIRIGLDASGCVRKPNSARKFFPIFFENFCGRRRRGGGHGPVAAGTPPRRRRPQLPRRSVVAIKRTAGTNAVSEKMPMQNPGFANFFSKFFAKFSQVFRKFSRVFASFFKFSDLLGPAWTCSDAFG